MRLTRRQFLGAAIASTAGLFAPASSLTARCSEPLPGERPRRLLADLHVHPTIDDWIRDSYLGRAAPSAADMARSSLNTTRVNWRRCHAAGVDVMCVAHFNMFDEWLSMPTDPNPDAPRQALRLLDLSEHALATRLSGYARLARRPAELKEIVAVPKSSKDYRIAVIHTLEGGHHLGGTPRAIESFARRGVAIITLTHFFNKGAGAAGNALPFFPDAAAPRAHLGLTGLGREFLAEMEKHGIVADVSHATARTVADILRVSRRPVVASHASVRALGDHPYSLADEHIQEIAADGGLVGIILMPYWLTNFTEEALAKSHGALRDVVRTVLHVMKITGTHRCVAIGSDYAGYIQGPREMKCLSDIHVLNDMLHEEIGERDAVDDIMANNVIRFLSDHWGAGS